MFNKEIEVTFFDLDQNLQSDFYLKCCDKETAFSDPTPRENFDWSLLVEGDKLTDLERYSSISSDMTSICSAEIKDIIDLFEISLENKSINMTPKENIDVSKS